ncbi:MAG: hypothetical protein AAGF47_12040, partial [Planctomycetota bacterium]
MTDRPPDAAVRIGEAADACPTGHGVVAVRAHGRCVHLVATADARGVIADKLLGDAPIGDEAQVWSAGSSFEADLLSLDLSLVHAPEQHAQAVGRLCIWWLVADRGSPGSGWRVTDLLDGVPGGTVVGPFLDRASAGRWSAMLDDRFELCRYPNELKKAPRGTPCAYRDMGLCPGACAGSEPMASYLERLDCALALRAGGLVELRGTLSADMQAAAAEDRFETAATLRDAAEALPEPDAPASLAVGDLAEFSFLAAAPGRGRARVVVLAIGLGGWRRLTELDARSFDADSA